jgi:hypothetical protein
MIDKFKPWLGSLALLPIIIVLTINNGQFIFLLDHFNLLIHEGGHGIFRLFGKFVYTLGGSLMQLLIPALFIFYFYSNKKVFGTQAALVFLGQNLLNVSKYVADARSQILPLLGGNKVYHDWHYLLSVLGILDYDKIVSYVLITFAIITFLIAMLIPGFIKKYDNIEINLNL